MPAAAKTMVVKIGSSTVTEPGTGVNRSFIARLAHEAVELRSLGWNLVVVSSGAIACGAPVLGFSTRPADMPSLQACASVGQCVLSAAYDEEFRACGLATSLVLLTRHDTARRQSYLHARDALTRLVELGVVPVVNENDTVSVDEIRFGDNDTLAALVACLVSADLCVTLSDIEGLYTANPSIDPNARFVPRVEKIDAAIIASAGDSSSAVGTGFVPPHARTDIAPRKLWIALGDAAHGSVTVDDGAARALVERGSSLLPVGIAAVEGQFEAGDVLDVRDAGGFVLARGIAEAGSDELQLAAGRQQREIAGNHLLQALAGRPAIHRDNLIVFA